jgi:hypothetical protein
MTRYESVIDRPKPPRTCLEDVSLKYRTEGILEDEEEGRTWDKADIMDGIVVVDGLETLARATMRTRARVCDRQLSQAIVKF